MSNDICQICLKEKYKYVCPRCNIAYCSVACYKNQKHIKCSEEFYKQCVIEEARIGDSSATKEDIRKIYDILKRMRQFDEGATLEDLNFNDDSDKSVQMNDSDDDDDDNNDEGEEVELSERLKDVDMNNAEEVWEKLTKVEREEFQKMITNGDIMKLIPNYTPWWVQKEEPKIIEISSISTSTTKLVGGTASNKLKNPTQTIQKPHIMKYIPKFETICTKKPSHCVHYNLWNMMTAYTATVRYFRGEHLNNANEACAHFLNLCTSLKYGTNFEDANDAIISVEMEALSTNNKVIEIMNWAQSNQGTMFAPIESREQLETDARQIMSTPFNKLAGLSDILSLFQLTKKTLKEPKNNKKMEFQKLFAFTSGMEEITYNKLQQLIKKIIYYLSYVNRDIDLFNK